MRRRPTASSRGTSTSQSVPDGLRTSSVAPDVALHPLLDLDRQEELRQPVQLAGPLGDDAADEGRVGIVEPLVERCVDARRTPPRGSRRRAPRAR